MTFGDDSFSSSGLTTGKTAAPPNSKECIHGGLADERVGRVEETGGDGKRAQAELAELAERGDLLVAGAEGEALGDGGGLAAGGGPEDDAELGGAQVGASGVGKVRGIEQEAFDARGGGGAVGFEHAERAFGAVAPAGDDVAQVGPHVFIGQRGGDVGGDIGRAGGPVMP